ncbi:MAG TPA: DEAD/DEAH box helicase [Rhizomicrobium sp.]|nr:DEAD/DEAH box helicase [Rhizomicrobium sp.]
MTISGAEAGTSEVATTSSTPSGFDGLGLSPEILKAVVDTGYTTPTPIQAQGIPVVLERRDLIGIAQTGTGKTASFTLPMIEMLSQGRAKARMPRALVLEPTRELADQVAESFNRYSKYSKLSHALLIGGVSMDDQTRKLDRGVDVLIATPGRLLDHFERGRLMLSQVNILVIDEADRMLDMGFIPDVERICKLLPFTRQTLFYSATMPPEIRRLTDQFLHNPVRIEVTRPATTAANITQEVVEIPANDWAKREALRRLIRENEPSLTNAIVFCNRKRDVDVVAKSLTKHGFDAAPIHGDLDQSVRTRTLDKFRAGELKILVASDVAARGLDVPSVSHIFNFDVPIHADDYVHRIGRTGRAGRSGNALMLATPRDAKYVDVIEKLIGNKLSRRSMTDIEVREDHSRRDQHRGRDQGRHKKRHDRRPPDGKFHEHVAATEPVQEARVEASAPNPAILDAPLPERRHEPHHGNKAHAPKRPPEKKPHDKHGRQAPEKEPVDKSQLPAFLFRKVRLPQD